MTGGVVFRAGGDLFFLPATVALKVLPAPEIARVPGAPSGLLGVALVEGEMVPVVAAMETVPISRPARPTDVRSMIVIAYHGERIGVVGVDVLATGHFDADPEQAEAVLYGTATAVTFDVAGLIGGVREGLWAV